MHNFDNSSTQDGSSGDLIRDEDNELTCSLQVPLPSIMGILREQNRSMGEEVDFLELDFARKIDSYLDKRVKEVNNIQNHLDHSYPNYTNLLLFKISVDLFKHFSNKDCHQFMIKFLKSENESKESTLATSTWASDKNYLNTSLFSTNISLFTQLLLSLLFKSSTKNNRIYPEIFNNGWFLYISRSYHINFNKFILDSSLNKLTKSKILKGNKSLFDSSNNTPNINKINRSLSLFPSHFISTKTICKLTHTISSPPLREPICWKPQGSITQIKFQCTKKNYYSSVNVHKLNIDYSGK